MKNKSRLNVLLSVLALVAVLGAGAGTAFAYFTSFAYTNGVYLIGIGERTEIHEEFSGWTKHMRISADATSGPVYIRAKAFHPDLYQIEYSDPDGHWNYNSDDGFWYYDQIVYAGQQTSELTVMIHGVPEEIKDPLDFGVAVVHEATPVRYDAQGNPYADWGLKLQPGEEAQDE